MAAASYDQIAFIIPVSGPGVTPAEQEVYRVEMQSRVMGLSEDEVARAFLIRRLMVDVFLIEPKYEAVNYDQAKRLGLALLLSIAVTVLLYMLPAEAIISKSLRVEFLGSLALSPFIFVIPLLYVLRVDKWTSKDLGFTKPHKKKI